MILSDKAYNLLKWLVAIALPAVGALYAGLAVFWELPKGTEVTGSIALVATFVGALIARSATNYNNSDEKYDGVIQPISADIQTTDTALHLTMTPHEVATKKDVLLKVEQ